jgi:hypothetical protein
LEGLDSESHINHGLYQEALDYNRTNFGNNYVSWHYNQNSSYSDNDLINSVANMFNDKGIEDFDFIDVSNLFPNATQIIAIKADGSHIDEKYGMFNPSDPNIKFVWRDANGRIHSGSKD